MKTYDLCESKKIKKEIKKTPACMCDVHPFASTCVFTHFSEHSRAHVCVCVFKDHPIEQTCKYIFKNPCCTNFYGNTV